MTLNKPPIDCRQTHLFYKHGERSIDILVGGDGSFSFFHRDGPLDTDTVLLVFEGSKEVRGLPPIPCFGATPGLTRKP